MAHPGEPFSSVDWANDPQFAHIRQVRADLLAVAVAPARYLRAAAQYALALGISPVEGADGH